MAVNGCPICLVKQRRIDESKKAICRGSFRSAEELVGNIEEFVTHLNMPAFRVDSHRLFDAQKDQKNISTYSWDVTLDAEINPGHLLLQKLMVLQGGERFGGRECCHKNLHSNWCRKTFTARYKIYSRDSSTSGAPFSPRIIT